jgi:tetratricopeptide (TPR) repeat protein
MADTKCRECGRVFAPADANQPCPACGSTDRKSVAESPEVPARPRVRAPGRRRWLPAVTLTVLGLGVVAAFLVGPRIVQRSTSNREPDAEALSRESEVALRRGNHREALAHADLAVRSAPGYAPGFVRRARAKYFLGDEYGALADCDEALRLDPGLALAHAYRAPVARLRGTPAAGVRDGERAVELMPDSPEALAGLALGRLHAGDAAGATEAAAKAVERAPDDPEVHRVHGLALAARGDAGASAEFDTAVRLSGDRPFYLAARADFVAGTPDPTDQDLVRAAADAERAVAADPNCAPAHLALANVHAVRERRPDVLAACEKAVAANPRAVDAYLRAAEDLSPRDLNHFQMLQTALAQILDLRELRGAGDFAFGALLADLQRLASARMKRDVTIYINFHSFTPQAAQTLRDAKVNLSSLMDATGENLLREITFKTVLDTLCRQVGAAFWVGPENIEIVARETAQREAAREPRLLSYDLIAPAELYRREERVLLFEQALRQTIDLRELKGGDFGLGALLADVQRLVSNRMKRDVTIYVNYESFPPEVRPVLRETKVNLGVLMDASGEQLLTAVKVSKVLDQLIRHLGETTKAQATSDYIETVWTGKSEGGEAAWRPLRLTGKPRPEAVRWLTRGIEQVPESARLYLARGQIHLEQYELDEAITDLTQSIERNPADARAYRLRSLAYAARGNPGDAALARADALATRP